jgi:hypothetical protein
VTVFDELGKIDVTNVGVEYEVEHIKVNRSFDVVEEQIDRAVQKIQERISMLRPAEWILQSPKEYYSDKNDISVSDRMGFASISQASNILFNAGYSEEKTGPRRSWFTPRVFTGHPELSGKKLWFIKIAILADDGNLVAAKGVWNNQLIEKGTRVLEIAEWHHKGRWTNKVWIDDDPIIRIGFAWQKNPLGITEYKFIGQFKAESYTFKRKNGKIVKERTFVRVDDTCPLIKS